MDLDILRALYFSYIYRTIKYSYDLSAMKIRNLMKFYASRFKVSYASRYGNVHAWTMVDMVKYRATIWSFLKLTALYFTMSSDIVHSATVIQVGDYTAEILI